MLAWLMGKKRELGMFLKMMAVTIWAVGTVIILASCGTSPGYNYTVGGSVSGMVGSGMVLQNNGGDTLTITSDGSFSFNTALSDGSTYSVTISTPPSSPSQTCIVTNGTGSISGAPVSNVLISCTMSSHPVTVDGSGSFAYMTQSADNLIGAGNIDNTTTIGALSKISTYNTGTNTNPTYLTIYPDPATGATDAGKYIYVANSASTGQIFVYTVNPDGSLTVQTTVTAGKYPMAVTVDLNGQFAYVANMGDGTVSAYSIDSGTGALHELTGYGSPFTAGTNPTGVTIVTINNTPKFAYVANMSDNTISAYSIDSTTGALSEIESPVSTGTYPTAITIARIDDTTQYAYVSNIGSSNISAYSIDSTTGELSLVGTYNTNNYPNPVTITKIVNGATTTYAAYVSNMGNSTVSAYTIDASTGVLNTVSGTYSTGIYPNPVTIAKIDDATQYAYISNMGDGTITAYKINVDGTLTSITGPSLGTSTYPNTVTIAKINNTSTYVAYVSLGSDSTIRAFTIDTSTGLLSEITGSPFTLF